MIYMIFIIISFISIFLTSLIYFFIPRNKLKNTKLFDFIGDYGYATTSIDKYFGVISLKDNYGNIKNYPCKSSKNKIEKGERVLITEFSVNDGLFIVDSYPII